MNDVYQALAEHLDAVPTIVSIPTTNLALFLDKVSGIT